MIYIFLCILFTIFGQVLLKWRLLSFEHFPDNIIERFMFTFSLLKDIYILAGFFSAFLASIFWMVALQKLELSFAYPFMSLCFVIVLILSWIFFKEDMNIYKIAGVTLIIIGTYVSSKGL